MIKNKKLIMYNDILIILNCRFFYILTSAINIDEEGRFLEHRVPIFVVCLYLLFVKGRSLI